MKNVMIVLIMLLFAACGQRLNTYTVLNDSIREMTKYIERVRVDTLIVEVPYEVMRDINPDTARAETSVARAKSWISMGNVVLDLRNKNTSLKKEVFVVDRHTTNEVQQVHRNTNIEIREISKMNGWQKWHYYVGLTSEILLICMICVWIGKIIAKFR